MRSCNRREVLIVAGLVCLLFVPFMGKAYHIDEPLYLPAARHILQDPRHPYDFTFNWYGRNVPYSRINNTPPLLHYLLALDLKATGGGEFPMRLAFLPLDLLAAVSLYFLAARFLRSPLLPTLIVLASPAYWIDMQQLMAEKPAAALGFAGLYAFVRGVDDADGRWFWASAGLLGAAALAKYNAVLFLAAAAGYGLRRGVPWRRMTAYGAAALSGLACYLLLNRAAEPAAWLVTSQAAVLPTARLSHKLRSILAFTGGGGLVTAVWPFWAAKPSGRRLAAVWAAVIVLFLPSLDLAPAVLGIDRLTGIVLSAGAAWGFWILFAQARRRPGGTLWAPWAAAVLLLLGLYWSVLERMVLFLMPPLVFAMAEMLEERWEGRKLRRFYLAGLVPVVAVSLALTLVDYRYAGAQKKWAEEALTRRAGGGGRVWCAAHWGLQYYLERGGAGELSADDGGWAAVRPGDVVLVPRVNSNILRPQRPVAARVRREVLSSPVPLRLISAGESDAGFYSNVTGFLPFALSLEPLDELETVQAR